LGAGFDFRAYEQQAGSLGVMRSVPPASAGGIDTQATELTQSPLRVESLTQPLTRVVLTFIPPRASGAGTGEARQLK